MDRGGAERDPESMVPRGVAAGVGEDGSASYWKKLADPPEKIINHYVLILTVALMTVRGLGILAFAWSTVVLLGGFVTLLHRMDFWFITLISFAQTARIFDASADEQYLYLLELLSRPIRGTVNKRILNRQSTTTSQADGFPCSAAMALIQIFSAILSVLLLLHPFFPLFNIAVSSLRLSKKDFGDEPNERPAAMIFYSLAISQGALYLLWFILEQLKFLAVKLVADGHGFHGKSLGRKYVEQYLKHTRSKCLDDLSATEGRDLIAYASGLLDSDHRDKYFAGAWILNHFISEKKLPHEELIRSSRKRIQKLVLMLSWKDKDYQEVRLLAAKIVLHVAGNISISQFPGTLESVSALIQPSKKNHVLFHSRSVEGREQGDSLSLQHSEEDAQSRIMESELIVHGLEILDKLTKDRNNGLEILRADALLVDIMAWICSKPLLQKDEQAEWLDIVRLSFRVLVRLAGLGAQSAERLRSKIHHELLPSWVPHYARHPKIQVMAIETYSHAFTTEKIGEEAAKNEIDQKRKKFVEVLLKLFLDYQDKWLPPSRPPAPEVRKKAGEALAELSVYIRNCLCLISLEEHKDDIVSLLEKAMHSENNIEYRAIAADILKRFYAFLCRPKRNPEAERIPRLRSVLNKALKLLNKFYYPEMETPHSDGIVHGDNNVTGCSQVDEMSSSQSDENHQARLEAALVRMIYDVHVNIKESFERVIEEDHPAGYEFVVLLKRLIVKNNRTTVYHLDIVKRTAGLICEILKYENSRMVKWRSKREAASFAGSVLVQKFVDEKILDSLSKASQIVSGEDSWTLFVHNRQRGAQWATSLEVLVEEIQGQLEKYKRLSAEGRHD